MRLVLPLGLAALALAGCAYPVAVPAPAPVRPAPVIVMPAPVRPAAPAVTPVTDVARVAANTVVNREMAKRLPGVNVAPYTACVINNASMAEIADLSGMVTGNDAAAANAVAAIVRRPATTQCIAGVARTA